MKEMDLKDIGGECGEATRVDLGWQDQRLDMASFGKGLLVSSVHGYGTGVMSECCILW